ncbi:hypothetical protein IKP85_04345 [bacterium]|nr:hypothetical protein [bacterium]
MLSPSITANLDYLASIGVLDYDAAADIAGTKPRYIGHPQHYVNPVVMTPMDSVTFSQSANGETYIGNKPFWKVLLNGALALGGIYLGGKIFLNIAKGTKKLSLKNIFSRGKKVAEEIGSDISKGVKKGKKAVRGAAESIGLVKKPWYKRVGDSISDAWKSFTGKFSGTKSHIHLRG